MNKRILNLEIVERFVFKPNHFSNKPDSTGLIHVFGESEYFDVRNFYIKYFGKVPNMLRYSNTKPKVAQKVFLEAFEKEVEDVYYLKDYVDNNWTICDIIFIMWNDVMVYVSHDHVSISFRDVEKDRINNLASILEEASKKERNEHQIQIITHEHRGFETRWLDIKPKKINLEENYNDDFMPIHQTILKRLKKTNEKGVVLLHGKPGTGKTSYLRSLITQIKKEIIFLPPNMAEQLINPELIKLLLVRENSIFIIEDAENIVMDRELSENSAMSTLLNLSDGLLSDCLNIQIICSFNIDISKVDNALMRKGRLIAQYEFKSLEAKKAQILSNKLGFNTVIASAMTLAEIYNQDDKNYSYKEMTKIGFK